MKRGAFNRRSGRGPAKRGVRTGQYPVQQSHSDGTVDLSACPQSLHFCTEICVPHCGHGCFVSYMLALLQLLHEDVSGMP